METKYRKSYIFSANTDNTNEKIIRVNSSTPENNFDFNNTNNSFINTSIENSTIEQVAQWFLNKSSMSNKKLQKLCYYAHCWYIVFFNDVEALYHDGEMNFDVLTSEKFQAWIHGPVSPLLYRKYKRYGWNDIPQEISKPQFSNEIEDLLEQVWDRYGSFTANELELISHEEIPWKNARKGFKKGEPCFNEISNKDILKYYSSL